VSDSRERALWGGGALSSVSSGGRGNSRHRAVGEAKCRNRVSGLFAHVGVRLVRRGTPARRRVSGVSGKCRARSRPRGYLPSAPAFVRACRSLGRRARLERRAEVIKIDRGSGGVSIAPLGGSSETPWPLRTVASGHGSFRHSGHQVSSRRTAGAFHESPFGSCHRWRHHAPLGGAFARRRSRGRLGVEGSFEGPPNTQMEPTRPTVCAIMALRRAAHLQRWAGEAACIIKRCNAGGPIC